jgi:hypothetical protein
MSTVVGRREGTNETAPTICDGKPSVLFFDLKVTESCLCTFGVSVHAFLFFTGLSTLFDILLSWWGVGHDVGFRVSAERV